MKRDQLNEKKIETFVEILKNQGIINDDEADKLMNPDKFGGPESVLEDISQK